IWAAVAVRTTPQAVAAIMTWGGAPALATGTLGAVLAGMSFIVTPLVGAYYIQPMLEIQRLTRPVTSVNYGKAAQPSKFYGPMRTKANELHRLDKRAKRGADRGRDV